MPLFQKSVLNKYLKSINQNILKEKYLLFSNHFLNSVIQENIRNNKEEQYQEGFLKDLFVDILGYTKNPTPNFNLTTELKNVKDNKKVDGAIIVNGNTKAVIELKGMNTTDLSFIENQAFGYKNNHADCDYVITSNFQKIRFYIDNAIDHLEFDLFNLSFEDFQILYLCLSFENIEKDIPKRIKDESLTIEDIITKKLYKDYSAFKRALFDNLVQSNKEIDPLTIFKKAQKLLDRFLFLFFAEDRGLLQPNSVRTIINRWEKRKEIDAYQPLIDSYRQYFGYLNTGHQSNDLIVFAYNGGLFAPDDILDHVKIDDEILRIHTLKIAKYDFASEVDVNILGHIFENSLNEIDEIQGELRGDVVEKTKTKRKKDGVFYTPKYITKYIVENTIGKLCNEKKLELNIIESDYYSEISVKKLTKKQKEAKKYLLDKLDLYRNWLLQLTICDPACGSGAFLNQALNFLISEHRYIDELQANLFGDALVLTDIEGRILENNLFGVDINEESIEIAKLSLWLRTAEPNRKLTSLSNNLKSGNSLIDDPAVSGDKAFNWKKEFPNVFAKGGFDVIIGNPPYVNANDLKKNLTKEEYNFLKSNYSTAKGTVDLYIYFYEKGLKIINPKGLLSYITPNRFLSASYGKALRELIISKFKIEKLIDYSDVTVFSDASTYPIIIFLSNKNEDNYEIITGKFDTITKKLISKNFPSDKLQILEDSILGFLLNDKLEITEKIISRSINLSSVAKINATSTAKEADEISNIINNSNGLKLINTGTIDPYFVNWGISLLTDKGSKYLSPYIPIDNPIVSNNRYQLYNSPKIVIAKIGLKCEAFYDKNGEYASINTNCIHSFKNSILPEYILCYLNSKIYKYQFECLFDGLRMAGGYLLFSAPNLKNTYIKNISLGAQQPFIEMADKMFALNKELQNIAIKFSKLLASEFVEIELSKKLQEWYKLEFTDFVKELKKKKIDLTLTQKSEWMDFFETEKLKANTIQSEIEATDKQIDQMVYELYELTPEEIEIVEQS